MTTTSDIAWMDFETYSKVDLPKHGRRRYVEDDSTNIVCNGFAFNMEEPTIWTPAHKEPTRLLDHVANGGKVAAFNATFDWSVWNTIGSRDFGWPKLQLGQMIDVQAVCRSYTLPGSLKLVSEALHLKVPKQAEGNALIKACCVPNKFGEQPMPTTDEMKRMFRKLYEYCKDDVKSMREACLTLPRQELIPKEQEIWELTVLMNENGVPIDKEAVDAILDYVSKYTEKEMRNVPKICGGYFQKITQVKKIQEWAAIQGYKLPNLRAETVTAALKDEDCPDKVRRILELRQELGRTSVAKYLKIVDQYYKGYVYDNLAFHVANTGRWGGRGFQLQNLPRAKVPNPEEVIEAFKRQDPDIEDPVGKAKALIRPMIKVQDDEVLMVADYKSIENRLLAYLAMDERVLNLFKDPLYDQYIDMAAHRFGVSPADVTSDQRFMGKQIILGCGYGMGGNKFWETCKKAGIKATLAESTTDVKAYRELYAPVVTLWKELTLAAKRAVISGKKQSYGPITFGTATRNGIKWLAMLYPSGKAIYYCHPFIEDRYIPGYEHLGKRPSLCHWGSHPDYPTKWLPLGISPGRLTENADQGLAREVMGQGLLNVHKRMKHVKLIGTVHDEGLSTVKKNVFSPDLFAEFIDNLCDIPWLPSGLVAASGYAETRYKKD
jgi:DNA polymerase